MEDKKEYVEKLKEVDTTGVEPLDHVFELGNVLRKDVCEPGISREDILDKAPRSKNGFFLVPPVIE